MAFTTDASTTYADSTTTSVHTYSHTVGTLTNGLLIVTVHSMKAAVDPGANHSIDSVTYNGTNLTRAATEEGPSTNRVSKAEIWYLVNPSSGANNVVITVSATTTGLVSYAESMSGADQTTPVGAVSANSGNGTTQQATFNTTYNNSLIYIATVERGDDNFNYTPLTGTTELADMHSLSGSPSSVEAQGAVGSRLTTTAGSYNIGFNASNEATQAVVATEFKEATSANVSVTPTTASLAITTYAPTVFASDNKSVTPSTASLTLTGYAPTVFASDNQQVTPDTASLTLSTFAPTVAVSNNITVTPQTTSLTLTTFAPTVTAGANVEVIPDTVSLTLTTFAPTVTTSDSITVTPDTASLTLTTFAPTVSASASVSVSVTPTTASLVLTGYAPTVTIANPNAAGYTYRFNVFTGNFDIVYRPAS